MFRFSVPVPTEAQAAVRQAIRWERAQQIIADGYGFVFDEQLQTVDVIKPGRLAAQYTIWLDGDLEGRKGCDCPDMVKTGEPCKHYLAASFIAKNREEEEDAARCAEYEARMAACEDEVYGCDPYARY
jgi:hypothetical protein